MAGAPSSPRPAADAGPVWIVEPNPEGHRLWYVRLLLEAAAAAGSPLPTVVTTARAPQSREWATHLSECDPDVRILDEANGWLRVVLAEATAARTHVVLLEADAALPVLVRTALRARGRLRGTGLLMRAHPQGGMRGRLAFAGKLVLTAALRLLAPAFTLRTLEAVPQSRHPASAALGLPVTPDPVVFAPLLRSREAWLRQAGIPERSWTLLVAGDLSERKHVPEILQALQHLHAVGHGRQRPGEPAGGVRLALVGRLSAGARQAYESLSPEVRACITLQEGYLSDAELDTWIAAADAVAVLHRNEGSSGILLKCAAAGTPVLAGGARTVRIATRALSLPARLVDPRPRDIARGLRELSRHEQARCPRNDLSGSARDFAASLLPAHGSRSAGRTVTGAGP